MRGQLFVRGSVSPKVEIEKTFQFKMVSKKRYVYAMYYITFVNNYKNHRALPKHENYSSAFMDTYLGYDYF